jgi:hypothetical protein
MTRTIVKKKARNISIILCALFSLFPILSHAQIKIKTNFKVSGFIKGADKRLIILNNKPASGIGESFIIKNLDSCYSKNDSFQFSFFTKEPSWYSIEIAGEKGWKSFVAVPNGQIKIEGKSDSLYKSKIIGSVEDSIYYAMTKGMLYPLYKAMSKVSKDSFKVYPDIIRNAKYNFIKENRGSFVVAKYLVEANSYNRNDSSELAY